MSDPGDPLPLDDETLARLAETFSVDLTPELLDRAHEFLRLLADPETGPSLSAGIRDLETADQLAWEAARSESGWKSDGHPLAIDPEAESADPDKPAFIAPPPGAPPFHGSVLLPGVQSRGFRLGMITDFVVEPNAVEGDLFLQAPDGSRAFVEWFHAESPGYAEIRKEDERTWGAWRFGLTRPLRSLADAQWHLDRMVPVLAHQWVRWLQAHPPT